MHRYMVLAHWNIREKEARPMKESSMHYLSLPKLEHTLYTVPEQMAGWDLYVKWEFHGYMKWVCDKLKAIEAKDTLQFDILSAK